MTVVPPVNDRVRNVVALSSRSKALSIRRVLAGVLTASPPHGTRRRAMSRVAVRKFVRRAKQLRGGEAKEFLAWGLFQASLGNRSRRIEQAVPASSPGQDECPVRKSNLDQRSTIAAQQTEFEKQGFSDSGRRGPLAQLLELAGELCRLFGLCLRSSRASSNRRAWDGGETSPILHAGSLRGASLGKAGGRGSAWPPVNCQPSAKTPSGLGRRARRPARSFFLETVADCATHA